jgi:hypothetical protein
MKHARTVFSRRIPRRLPPIPARFLLRPQLLTRLYAPRGQDFSASPCHGADEQARP